MGLVDKGRVVAINASVKDLKYLKYLYEFDSVLERFPGTVDIGDGGLIVNGEFTHVFVERETQPTVNGVMLVLNTFANLLVVSSLRMASWVIKTAVSRKSSSLPQPRMMPQPLSTVATSIPISLIFVW